MKSSVILHEFHDGQSGIKRLIVQTMNRKKHG